MNAGAAAGSSAAAAAIQATKASGVVVRVEGETFRTVVKRAEAPLVVHAPGGLFSKKHRYLTSYKGLAFFTKVPEPLYLPGVEIVEANAIWVPD